MENLSRIIRKLGSLETWLHNEYLSEGLYCTIFANKLVTSGYDLFQHADLVHQAIGKWMNMHPFLRCIISQDKKDNTLFFQYCNQDYLLANTNKYVSFIKYENNKVMSEADRDLIWKLVVDHENRRENKFDLEKGPLWKLLFFKFNEEHFCCFKIHHSIMDGRSAHTCFLHLLELIESLLMNQESNSDLLLYEPFASVDELYVKNENGTRNFYEIPVKIPAFLKSEDTSTTRKTQFAHIQNGIFCDLEGKTPFTLDELIKSSSEDNSKTLFCTVGREKYLALLAKSKQQGVKFTALLNTIFAHALKQVYEFNNDSETALFKLLSPVSLREYPPISELAGNRYLNLCTMINILLSYIQVDSFENFWHTAKTHSDSFHAALKQGHHMKVAEGEQGKDELSYHIGTSSFGVQPASLTEQKLLRVCKSFVACREPEDSYAATQNYLVYVYFAAIEDTRELNMSLTFDSKFISCESIFQFNEHVFRIIDKLIRD